MILFDLERFAIAQAPVFPAVLDELRAGLVLTGQTLPGPIPVESAEEIS